MRTLAFLILGMAVATNAGACSHQREDPDLRSKMDRVRTDIETIGLIAEKYRIDNDDWPDSLKELRIRQEPGGNGKTYLKEELLTDPWGRHYMYDKAGPRNKGERPDVWSNGPDPNGTTIIGNWR